MKFKIKICGKVVTVVSVCFEKQGKVKASTKNQNECLLLGRESDEH